MKNKIIVGLTSLLLPFAAMAQTAAVPVYRFLPFFTGFNVQVPTNTIAGMGVPNLLFSDPQGQNVFSLTNNIINGTTITNTIAPDAFRTIGLRSDVNGDINANATVIIAVNNTNLIPIGVTNSFGQYFVTNWPLAVQQFPNWMYPATTNVFPLVDLSDTNLVTVSLFKVTDIRGGFGTELATSTPQLVETTSSFSFSFNPNLITGQVVYTNLPAGWLQGARNVRATITVAPNSAAGTGANPAGILINQLGILQPQP